MYHLNMAVTLRECIEQQHDVWSRFCGSGAGIKTGEAGGRMIEALRVPDDVGQ